MASTGGASGATGATAAAIEAKYVKKDLRQQIYDTPDTYIGSVEPETITCFVINEAGTRAVEKPLDFVPGLNRIVVEVLVNSRDQFVRLDGVEGARPVRSIDVTIDRATGAFSVRNDGDGIDVEVHPEHKVYVPELIFGVLLTSTNYDASAEKIVGGKNGYGAKLTNIFSTAFTVETVDAARGRLYTQTWSKNMTAKDKPKVKAFAKAPYTRVSFTPDYARFKLDGITDDIFALFRKQVFDLAACLDGKVAVTFNGARVPVKSFSQYADLILGPKADHDRAYYADPSGRWEVVATYHDTDGGLKQVSFVNGIWTSLGGKHVDYIVNQITAKLVASVAKKRAIKAQTVKDNLFVLINATVVNPSFSSQSKETLVTNPTAFGSTCVLPDDVIKKIAKTGLLDRVLELAELLDNKKLAKTDGRKKSRINVPKLDDANKAGTKDSHLCTLILTEGDSAKTMAISGLSAAVGGREIYGVFPLRGKLLNVRDTAAAKISANAEITALKQILGLRAGVDYVKEGISSLRYGHVMLMTDQDADGSHIKGLLMNAFDAMFPSLLRVNGFLVSMLTPIVKVSRPMASAPAPATAPDDKGKKAVEVKSFYLLSDYERWAKEHHAEKGWTHKYYKGLGTSTSTEAKEYFGDMKLTRYTYTGKTSDDAINLAFNVKLANDRKGWIMRYDKDVRLDYTTKDVTFDEFINKDLIHFSVYDNMRSIPSGIDGWKPSQRKVFFGCNKRKLWTSEVKVAQLSGFVSEHAAYHHGEVSLQETIVGMAQTYVGSGNNINVLEPSGQFGTRLAGGKDHASARYIFTVMTPVARKVFRAEDNPVLEYLEDDGDPCEPLFYVPIIPFALCNGAQGIGTGFSVQVPCHDPRALADACVGLIDALVEAGVKVEDEEDAAEGGAAHEVVAKHRFPTKAMEPWFKDFKGQIAGGKSFGRYARLEPKGGSARVEIQELPLGSWTDDYKAMLEDDDWPGNKRGLVRDFEMYHTETTVRIVVRLTPEGDAVAADPEKFVDVFKLASSKMLGTTNMHLFSAEQRITKYDSASAIFKAFVYVRLATYVKRKKHEIKTMTQELKILDARARFIAEVCDGTVKVMNTPAKNVAAQLKGAKPPYPTLIDEPVAGTAAAKAAKDDASNDSDDVVSTEDGSSEDGDERQAGGASAKGAKGASSEIAAAVASEAAADVAVRGYAYLLGMSIGTLTREKKIRLEIESAALRRRLEELRKTPLVEIWRRELGELSSAL